jgi:uncharacterized SAM-binding protein YcdF (DUF218 family)
MFYLSKIVWWFFQPSTLIALMLFAGLALAAFRKRSGSRLIVSAAALYAILGFSPVANWLLIPLEHRYKAASSSETAELAGIIVLGGAVTAAAEDTGRAMLNDSADRMIEAVRLAQMRPSAPVIFSGGKGDLFDLPGGETEAELARRFFEDFGIKPPRLKLEDRSRNTLENAVFTAELLQPRADQRWALVTSAFHMPRARSLFEAQGFRIVPAPADIRTRGASDRWHFFTKPSDGLRRVDLAAKEWVGLFASWLRGDIAWPHASDR